MPRHRGLHLDAWRPPTARNDLIDALPELCTRASPAIPPPCRAQYFATTGADFTARARTPAAYPAEQAVLELALAPDVGSGTRLRPHDYQDHKPAGS